ncbi:hypothetical protein FQN55_001178 [Onygenales sp. PD_40]|nr:hypothetical protein FQN55_001178 [Onygenales sp. PD_40]KAK2803908.1 hypothetical protein FQN51_002794 [Onygenales sp. PD_10]
MSSESITTFNGRRCTKVARAGGASTLLSTSTISTSVTTTPTVSVASTASQTTFISVTPSITATSQIVVRSSSSSSQNSPPSDQGNAGAIFMPDSTGFSRDPPPSTSTGVGGSPRPTRANMSAQGSRPPEDPNDESSPRKLGAIIGGTVGGISIIFIVLALWFALRRWKRKRRIMEPIIQSNFEKEVQIDPPYESSRFNRTSRYSTRTLSVYSESDAFNSNEPSASGFRRSRSRNFSKFFEKNDKSANPITSLLGTMKDQAVTRLRKVNLLARSNRTEEEEWRQIPSPKLRESISRSSRSAVSIDIPNPFLDPPKNSSPESSLRRPPTPHYGMPRRMSSRNPRRPRRSMSEPSVSGQPPMRDENGRIQSFIPSPSISLPLNFGFSGEVPVPPPLHIVPTGNPGPGLRNGSMSSQSYSSSNNSGSVILLPGRISTASSSILEASASDLSRWRRQRSAFEGGGIARRSDPFDLERPDSGFTGDESTREDTDSSGFPDDLAVAVAVASSRPRLVS